uniref:Uncharacterized protein n=1 Tax=Setaria viridis TaxID=4556 RepID=A0A4U6W969_SETVI|nr:hypothetical protein SEVIR_1G103500v2 [Setaria viridis]
MALNTKEQNQLKVPSTERMPYTSMNRTVFPTIQEQLGTKESIFKFPRMKMELGAIGRNLVKMPTHAIQPNLLLRAVRVISRSARFAF